MVKDRTAQAFSQYVAKRGKGLKKLDLTMNKGIPEQLLEEICTKYDMGEEYIKTMEERRKAAKQLT